MLVYSSRIRESRAVNVGRLLYVRSQCQCPQRVSTVEECRKTWGTSAQVLKVAVAATSLPEGATQPTAGLRVRISIMNNHQHIAKV